MKTKQELLEEIKVERLYLKLGKFSVFLLKLSITVAIAIMLWTITRSFI